MRRRRIALGAAGNTALKYLAIRENSGPAAAACRGPTDIVFRKPCEINERRVIS